MKSGRERRKYTRYDTEFKVYFRPKYDLKTRVKFQVLPEDEEHYAIHKYSGLCKNVSVEGLCFYSKKKLGKGDILLIEVYEPIVKGYVTMEGEVRWSRMLPEVSRAKGRYYTGVKLLSVNGMPVSPSIYFDKKYNVVWSAALDSIFGNFAAMLRKKK